MKTFETLIKFTTSEFAKLHGINNRTLHFYDSIGLFHPRGIEPNGYRYYTYEQSMELEAILTFKELGMSLEEIKTFMDNPSDDAYLKILNEKSVQIRQTIKRMRIMEQVLVKKTAMVAMDNTAKDGHIEVLQLPPSHIQMTFLPIRFDNDLDLDNNAKLIMEHIKSSDALGFCRISSGSFISLDKLRKGDFESYDGLFSTFATGNKNFQTRPQGTYLRGYSIGSWDKIPALYEAMFEYAQAEGLTLEGYSYESGLNDFIMPDNDKSVTMIEIRCV